VVLSVQRVRELSQVIDCEEAWAPSDLPGGGRSFYNMTGFGDISILALLKTQQIASASMIPGLLEEIEVVSSDVPLISKIKKEFRRAHDAFGATIKLTKTEDFF